MSWRTLTINCRLLLGNIYSENWEVTGVKKMSDLMWSAFHKIHIYNSNNVFAENITSYVDLLPGLRDAAFKDSSHTCSNGDRLFDLVPINVIFGVFLLFDCVHYVTKLCVRLCVNAGIKAWITPLSPAEREFKSLFEPRPLKVINETLPTSACHCAFKETES